MIPIVAWIALVVVLLVGCRDLRYDKVVTLPTPERFSVGQCFSPHWTAPRERWSRPLILRVVEIGERYYLTEYYLDFFLGYGGSPERAIGTTDFQAVQCPKTLFGWAR